MLDLAATPDNRRLELERELPAPRELVWKMFSDPYHLAQWWGPKGCTNPIVELDFRVGGRWYHVMHCLDGNDYPADSEFVEISRRPAGGQRRCSRVKLRLSLRQFSRQFRQPAI